MGKNRVPKVLLNYKLEEQREIGRPNRRWKDEFK
jgi:hypothetical protein